MKRNLFVIIFLMLLMIGGSLGGIVKAVPSQDDRYTSFSGVSPDFYFGDWDNFTSRQGARHVDNVYFYNDFGPVIEQRVHYEDVSAYFSVGQEMAIDGRNVTMKIWAGPEAQGIGVRFEVVPTGLYNRANICFGGSDYSWGVTKYVDDFTAWLFAIEFRIAFENNIEFTTENRQYILDAKFYRYDAVTFEKYYVGRIPAGVAPVIGEAYGIGEDIKFYHSIVADYGTGYPTHYNSWQARFFVMNAGCMGDVMYSDCTIDLFDLVGVTGWYGDALGYPYGWTWNEWMWLTPCWKADGNQNFQIDINDVTIVATKYGQEW